MTNFLGIRLFAQHKSAHTNVSENIHLSITQAIYVTNNIKISAYTTLTANQFKTQNSSDKLRNAIGCGAWIGAVTDTAFRALAGFITYKPWTGFAYSPLIPKELQEQEHSLGKFQDY